MRLHRPLGQGVNAALREIFQEKKYADKTLQRLFQANRKWGKRDRAFVAENVYDMVRWWRKLWACLPDARTGEFGAGNLENVSFSEETLTRLLGVQLLLHDLELPDWPAFAKLDRQEILQRKKVVESTRAVAHSIPDWLDELGEAELGQAWNEELSALNRQAEVVLRANTLRTTPAELQAALAADGWETDTTPLAPQALVLRRRGNIFTHPLFKKGHFEVQDAGSQCIVPYLQPEPGQRIIDACAGAGGKTLHLAALMQNRGSLLAMDTEAWKLDELRKRARRNGVQIVQTRPIVSTKVIKRQKETADGVLLDVPCSGLGVLRRNPDAKWKLSLDFVERLRTLQADILQRYSQMVKPGGKLVYATCSILPSENELQVQAFLAKNADFELLAERRISPAEAGFDGFYMARLRRQTTT